MQPPCPPKEGSRLCEFVKPYKIEYARTLLWRAGRLKKSPAKNGRTCFVSLQLNY